MLCVCALLSDFSSSSSSSLNKSQTIEHEFLRGGASEKSKLFFALLYTEDRREMIALPGLCKATKERKKKSLAPVSSRAAVAVDDLFTAASS